MMTLENSVNVVAWRAWRNVLSPELAGNQDRFEQRSLGSRFAFNSFHCLLYRKHTVVRDPIWVAAGITGRNFRKIFPVIQTKMV